MLATTAMKRLFFFVNAEKLKAWFSRFVLPRLVNFAFWKVETSRIVIRPIPILTRMTISAPKLSTRNPREKERVAKKRSQYL